MSPISKNLIGTLGLMLLLFLSCNEAENKTTYLSNSDKSLNEILLEGGEIKNARVTSSCSYNDLSNEYRFHIRQVPFLDSLENYSSTIYVRIIDKKTNKIVDTFQYIAELDYELEFRDSNNAISFTTGKNMDLEKEYSATDVGNMAVVDINFDGLEDLAFQCGDGGNTGSLYS